MDTVDVVERLYAAINRADAAMFDLLDPEIVWATPSTLPWGLTAYGGVYQGMAQLREYFGSFVRQVADGRVDVQSMLTIDDERVLALGVESGTARATGERFAARCAHLWTMQAGKVVRLEGFPDTATMCAAFTTES